MSGTAFSASQLAELHSIITPSFAKALSKIASKCGDPKRVLNALNGKNELLAERLETMSLEDAIKSFLVLIPRGRITITIGEARDPDTWYRTREGLYVWDGFRNRVVAKAKSIPAGTTYNLDVFELGENLTDEQIEMALPKNHLFDESAVSAILAEGVTQQPNGASGFLKSTDYAANLLYTGSSVAYGCWRGVCAEWSAGAYARDDDRWVAGARVFSPAT